MSRQPASRNNTIGSRAVNWLTPPNGALMAAMIHDNSVGRSTQRRLNMCGTSHSPSSSAVRAMETARPSSEL